MGGDHPYSLEVCVHDGGAYKPHPPPLEIPGNRVGQGGAGLSRLADHLTLRPVPEVGREAAPLRLDAAEHPGVFHRCPDFSAGGMDAQSPYSMMPDFLAFQYAAR